MATQSNLKLTAARHHHPDDLPNEYTSSYGLTIYNTGPKDEHVMEVGVLHTNDRGQKVPVEEYKIKLPFGTIPSGDKYWQQVSSGNQQNPIFYAKTEAGVIVPSTKRSRKIEWCIALMQLSKRITPKHKAIPVVLAKSLVIVGPIVLLSLIVWVGLITHDRSGYEAIGTIDVSPANSPNKYYTLKVGNLNEAAKHGGATDTIFVTSSATHWYSLFSHYEYIVSDATWSNGGKLTFHDTDCTVPSMKVRIYCVADDGNAYYVGIESVGPNIVDQLNGP